MAKKSAVNRNERVKKLVKQYAAKRDALKKVANDQNVPLEERFDARLKLAELPRNSSKTRIRNRCEVTGRTGCRPASDRLRPLRSGHDPGRAASPSPGGQAIEAFSAALAGRPD